MISNDLDVHIGDSTVLKLLFKSNQRDIQMLPMVEDLCLPVKMFWLCEVYFG